jgi:AraC-like DNA-binding protein
MNKIYGREFHAPCVDDGIAVNRLIELVGYPEGEMVDLTMEEPVIIFVTEGKLELMPGSDVLQIIDQGNLFLLPVGFRLLFRCTESARLVYCRIRENIPFCDDVKLHELRNILEYKKINIDSSQIYTLEIKQSLDFFLSCLLSALNDGLSHNYYFEIKLNELFILLNVYYPNESLSAFFYPLLNEDFIFKTLVFKNRTKVFAVNELAAIVHLSPIAFREHFKRIFGVLPSDWLNEERAKLILHELTMTNKPLKQICEECRFLSLSCFNRFCKKHLKNTPYKIKSQFSSTVKDADS